MRANSAAKNTFRASMRRYALFVSEYAPVIRGGLGSLIMGNKVINSRRNYERIKYEFQHYSKIGMAT